MVYQSAPPPKFFGEQRYINKVLQKEDTVAEVITLEEKPLTSPRASFTYNSSSDFLMRLVGFPSEHTLVAETNVYWSSQKSTRTGRASQNPIQTILASSSTGVNLTPQITADATINDTDDTSEISSAIDSKPVNRPDEFDSNFKLKLP